MLLVFLRGLVSVAFHWSDRELMLETLTACCSTNTAKLIKWLVVSSSLWAQQAFVLVFLVRLKSPSHMVNWNFYVWFDKSKLPGWQLQPHAKNTATVGARRTRITAYQRWKLRGARCGCSKSWPSFSCSSFSAPTRNCTSGSWGPPLYRLEVKHALYWSGCPSIRNCKSGNWGDP